MLSFIRDFWSSECGATAVIAGLMMPLMVGFAGLAIDVGHVS